MNCVDRLKNIRGGRLALIYNNADKVKFIETNPRPTFETGIWRIGAKKWLNQLYLLESIILQYLKPIDTQLRNLLMIYWISI